MGEVIAAILGLIRTIIIGPWWAKLLGVGIIGSVGTAVYLDGRKRKNQIRALPFAGVSMNGESKTLHVIPMGCSFPKNISEHLRGFQNAGELYHYAYQEFGEALFDKIIIHSQIAPPTTFIRNENHSDEENLALLHAQLTSA